MTWIANILIVCGLYLIGGKHRTAFLFTFAGELIWTIVSFHQKMYDLASICALFSILALVNWYRWRPDICSDSPNLIPNS